MTLQYHGWNQNFFKHQKSSKENRKPDFGMLSNKISNPIKYIRILEALAEKYVNCLFCYSNPLMSWVWKDTLKICVRKETLKVNNQQYFFFLMRFFFCWFLENNIRWQQFSKHSLILGISGITASFDENMAEKNRKIKTY